MSTISYNSTIVTVSPENQLTLGQDATEEFTLSTWKLVGGCILCVITLITIVGNVLAVVVLTRQKRFRSRPTYAFITSMAIADTLVGVIVMPLSITNLLGGKWYFGTIACKLFVSSDVCLCTASCLNLVAVTSDRYIAVLYPFSYRSKLSKTRTKLIIFSVWLASVLISFPPIHLGWNKVKGSEELDPHECFLEAGIVYTMTDGLVFFFLPLIIMCGMYVKIARVVRKSSKTWKGSRVSNPENRLGLTVAMVMTCFVVCWLPFMSYFTFSGLTDWEPSEPWYSMLFWLTYFNSTLNPIIYCGTNTHFREAFLDTISRRSRAENQRNSTIFRTPASIKVQSGPETECEVYTKGSQHVNNATIIRNNRCV
ncbi:histamine H2 receptor-like [Anneissia japonica]|uniref:histamine H2 receptor-like n=1 Tax=Anneissia japonica TaxID=1529436 RepID=UPI0014255E79|nr:histamine H2 receptor-like [Anneissia japonica]